MTSTAIRLIARHPLPTFFLPAAAFQALDEATRGAREASMALAPCGPEEATVLATWLNMTLHDPGAEADRAELIRGCPDSFGSGVCVELIVWLLQSGGFSVERGARMVQVPSEN